MPYSVSMPQILLMATRSTLPAGARLGAAVESVAAPILGSRMSEIEPADVRELWRTTEPFHAVAYFAPEVVEAEARLGSEGLLDGLLRRPGRTDGRGRARRSSSPPSSTSRRGWSSGRCPTPGRSRRRQTVLADRASTASTVRCAALLGPLVGSAELRTAAELARAGGRRLSRPRVDRWPRRGPASRRRTTRISHCGWRSRSCASTAATVTWPRSSRTDSTAARCTRCWWRRAARRGPCSSGPAAGTTTQWDGGRRSAAATGAGSTATAGSPSSAAIAASAIEGTTDRLAAAPWAVARADAELDRFAQAMAPLHAAIAARALIPYPNPMGLTAPTT